MHVACQKCGQAVDCGNFVGGTKLECPRCKTIFVVPHRGVVQAAAPPSQHFAQPTAQLGMVNAPPPQVVFVAPQPAPAPVVHVHQPRSIHVEVQSNGFGTAGFIVALISFFTCGLVSPLALIMCFIGLFGRPKGMAAAGFILSLIGSWWLFAFGFAIILGMLGLGAAGTAIANLPPPEKPKSRAVSTEQPRFEAPRFEKQPATNQPFVEQPRIIPEPEQPAPDLQALEQERRRAAEELAEQNRLAQELAAAQAAEQKAAAELAARRRTWSSADGQFKVEADFVSYGGGKVKLRRVDNGKELSLDEEILSPGDMAWIRSRLRN